MRIDFDTSSCLVLEHIVSGVAVFNGSSVGRAAVTSGIGNSAVVFRARKLGTDFNGYKINLINPGRDNASEVVTFDPGDTRLNVVLRYAAGAVTSTSAQVATAVQTAGLELTATYGGTGAGVVVPATTALTGAIDPTIVRNTRYSFSPAGNGGFFSFDQGGNVVVRQFEAKLSASVAWTLTIVNLDEGLREDTATEVQVAGNTGTDVFISNLGLVLSPLRALKFSASAQGVARIIGHKDPNFPL